MTFKTDLYAICSDVATEFLGWSFSSGQFKNSTLRHTDLEIHLGFGFRSYSTSVQPSVSIINKRISKLNSYIFGKNKYPVTVSLVNMHTVAHLLKFTPEKMRTGYDIYNDKNDYLIAVRKSGSFKEETIDEKTIDISEARPVLMASLKDGIDFINGHYNLNEEIALLKGLPPKYTTRHDNISYGEMEKTRGVMLCVVRVLLGDFDFVVRYRSDDFKTVYPKQIADLDKIIAALPELKKRYEETGSVI